MTNRLLVELLADGRVSVGTRLEGEAPTDGDPAAWAWPLPGGALEELRWYLEDYLRAPFGVYGDRGPAVAAGLTEWGTAMFSSVFGAGQGRDAYERLLARGDDVEVIFRSSVPELLGLPWELLRDPGRPRPLAVETAGLSRSLSVADSAQTIPVPGGRLRVLMVISRPAGTADVGYRMVARPLLERLDAVHGRVELVILRPPTLDALGQALDSADEEGRPFQIVHFDGHGVPAALPMAEGGLVFERPHGGADLVPASRVAEVLGAGRVPVVVLNACQSGAIGEDLAATVATGLLRAGTASVVAMAYNVYAMAAAEFMAAFYERLFAGGTVSAAVTAGRRRLYDRDGRPSPKGEMPLADWMVPVHYMRRDVMFPQAVTERSADLPLDTSPDRTGRDATGPSDAEPALAPVGDFVGRDDLFYELEIASRSRRVVVLHGPAGTGKTELAKAFGRWWRETGGVACPEWVVWHSFAPGMASFSLDAVITQIGLRVYGGDFGMLDPAARQTAVTTLLREQRLLLIWDNFETVRSMPEQGSVAGPLDEAGCRRMRDFLAELAGHARSAVLITSRNREDWLGDVHRVDVGGLAAHEAIDYADRLLAACPAAAPRRAKRAFGELMEWLGGHPLSMRLTLPMLDRAEPEAVLDGLRGTAPLPDAENLAISIGYSYDHLAEATRRLLPALGLLQGVAEADDLAGFSETPWTPQRFRGATAQDWRLAMADAAGAGLLTELGPGLYGIHPALPAYLTARWHADEPAAYDASREAATRALLEVYAARCDAYTNESGPDDLLLDKHRRTIGGLLAHALDHRMWTHVHAFVQALYTYFVGHDLAAEADAWDERILPVVADPRGGPRGPEEDPAYGLWVFLASSAAKRRMLQGRLDDAERGYRQLREVLQRQSPSRLRQQHLAVTCYTLGLIDQSRGRLDEAQAWYQESLILHQEIGDQSGLAISYHHLGSIAKEQGRPAEARDLCLRSLAIAEKLGEQTTAALDYTVLGSLAQGSGHLDEAEQWYLKLLAITEASGSRAATAVAYNELGSVALARRRLDEAERWYLRALTLSEALGDRTSMHASYGNLGIVAHRRERLAEARDWYRKALVISEEAGNKPGTAAGMANLGLIAAAQGDFDEALTWSIQCVALFEEFPRPETSTGANTLAWLAARLGMPAVATRWAEITGRPLAQGVRDYVRDYVEAHRPTSDPRGDSQMTAPVRVAARAAAARLDAEYGPGLVADVEAALNAGDPAWRPNQYIDPVAIGSLIVSVATLAWTIYTDLKKKTPTPQSDTVIRAVRDELREHGDTVPETITEVVVAEIVRTERDTP